MKQVNELGVENVALQHELREVNARRKEEVGEL